MEEQQGHAQGYRGRRQGNASFDVGSLLLVSTALPLLMSLPVSQQFFVGILKQEETKLLHNMLPSCPHPPL